MPSADQLRALETQIAPAAVACERLTGLPAELTCAQCILASAWLERMPSGSRNPFGIRATDATIGVLAQAREWLNAQELWAFVLRGKGRSARLDSVLSAAAQNGRRRFVIEDYFAAFNSLADAFVVYAGLMLTRDPYKDAVKKYQSARDLRALMRAVGPAHASDPGYAAEVEYLAMSAEVADIVAKLRVATSGYTAA